MQSRQLRPVWWREARQPPLPLLLLLLPVVVAMLLVGGAAISLRGRPGRMHAVRPPARSASRGSGQPMSAHRPPVGGGGATSERRRGRIVVQDGGILMRRNSLGGGVGSASLDDRMQQALNRNLQFAALRAEIKVETKHELSRSLARLSQAAATRIVLQKRLQKADERARRNALSLGVSRWAAVHALTAHSYPRR